MEPKFQTSFIPKKPIVSNEGSGMGVVRPTNIFSLIATIFFLVTVIISGGFFVYKRVLKGQIAQANLEIQKANDAIELEKIKELIDSNSRIVSSQKLLEKHITASNILLLMQELTVKRMRFTNMSYKNTESQIDLIIRGEVQSYNALAQQEKIFSESEFLRDQSFSTISLIENGQVSLEFSAKIDSSLISYKKAIESLPLDQ